MREGERACKRESERENDPKIILFIIVIKICSIEILMSEVHYAFLLVCEI